MVNPVVLRSQYLIKLVKPLETATLITLISQLHPREFKWVGQDYIDKLFGSNQLSLLLLKATWLFISAVYA